MPTISTLTSRTCTPSWDHRVTLLKLLVSTYTCTVHVDLQFIAKMFCYDNYIVFLKCLIVFFSFFMCWNLYMYIVCSCNLFIILWTVGSPLTCFDASKYSKWWREGGREGGREWGREGRRDERGKDYMYMVHYYFKKIFNIIFQVHYLLLIMRKNSFQLKLLN